MKNKLSNPHDHYFRSAMQDIRIARGFLSKFLPGSIVNHIDLNTLKLADSCFVDNNLENSASDILYEVTVIDEKHLVDPLKGPIEDINQSQKETPEKMKPVETKSKSRKRKAAADTFKASKGYIYVLIEHQSSADKLMPFRLFRYMFEIINKHLKQYDTTTLPIIYPMVIYNGKQRYNYFLDILDLFEDKSLARSILQQPFPLVDIGNVKDDALKQEIWSGLMMQTMKQGYKRDLLACIRALLPMWEAVESAGNGGYIIEESLNYVLYTSDQGDLQEAVDLIRQSAFPSTEAHMMTIAEQLIEQGMQQGVQQGVQQGREQGLIHGESKGKKEVATRMLNKGLPVELVAEVTQLSLTEVEDLDPAYH